MSKRSKKTNVKKACRQVAALAIKRAPELEVLLVSSLDTGRWILPKGWPMPGKPDHEAAAQEAFEEAGVQGRIAPAPIGFFDYEKRRKGAAKRCRVDVYPLDVESQGASWPEKGLRRLRWLSCAEAARLADDPGLSELLASFARLCASDRRALAPSSGAEPD
jgi:8-oxo-dGTP pyrophosphatase MutT (NUDIX family)